MSLPMHSLPVRSVPRPALPGPVLLSLLTSAPGGLEAAERLSTSIGRHVAGSGSQLRFPLQVVPQPSGSDQPWCTQATWGVLIAAGGEDLLAATELLAHTRLANRTAVVAALNAYSDLLNAIAVAWRGLWAGRLIDTAPDPVRGLGHRLAARAQRGSEGSGEDPATSAVTSLLRSAAVSVRSTSDLLATHRDPGGAWRCPESGVLGDRAAVLGAAGELARLVVAQADALMHLKRQVQRAGMGAAQVTRRLGGLGALAADARQVRRVVPPPDPRLSGLGVARPALRPGSPVAALIDRLARVRRIAWELTVARRVPVTTLADIAASALDLQRYAQACGWPGCDRGPWERIRRGLGDLRTVTAPYAALRADVMVVRWLLATALRPEQARPVVQAALGRLPELAGWGAIAFGRAADDLYLTGSALRGHEVSDYPELAMAKLSGRIVLVPCDRVFAIRAAYADAGADSSGGECWSGAQVG